MFKISPKKNLVPIGIKDKVQEEDAYFDAKKMHKIIDYLADAVGQMKRMGQSWQQDRNLLKEVIQEVKQIKR